MNHAVLAVLNPEQVEVEIWRPYDLDDDDFAHLKEAISFSQVSKRTLT